MNNDNTTEITAEIAPDTSISKASDSRRKLIAATLAIFAIGAIIIAQFVGTTNEPSEPTADLDVEFTNPNGSIGTLAAFKGEPLIVNFFASWCGPCIAEMPDFEEVNQSEAGRVAIVGIAFQDTLGAASAIVAETGVTYQWGLDETPNTNSDVLFALAPNSFGMPTTVFIAADGVILDIHQGALTKAALLDAIDEWYGDA